MTLLAWEERGVKSAPPTLLLHSLGLDRRLWAPQIAAWESRRNLIAIDLRGHGRSPAPPGPYVLDALGRDVLETADQLGLERFDLCGVSLGGIISLWMAIECPERVRRLVVSNSGARIASAEIWSVRKAQVEAQGIGGIREAALARWFTPAIALSERDRWAAVLDATSTIGYAACCAALAEADLRPQIPKIRAPALFIGGAHDTATPPELSRWLEGQVSGSRYAEIAGTAHLSNIEKASAWTQVVDAFLDSR